MELTIDQALRRAVDAHRTGKLQEAEKLYRAIIRVHPKHPDANHNLGLLAVNAGRPESALPYFKTAVDANSTHGQYWISYINGLILCNRLDDARRLLDQAVGAGLSKDAAAQLEQSLASSTASLSKYPSQHEVNAVLSYYNSGNLAAAKALATTLTKSYPHHSFGWMVAGVVLGCEGRLMESLESLREAIRVAPNNADAHSNLGNTLRDLGQLNDAEAAYREAIRLKPEFADAHSNLGNALRDLGQLNDAEAAYREAIRLKPEFADAHSNLGNALRDLGRLIDAETAYREAIRLKPDLADAHSNLGITLKNLGRLSEAETACREAIRLKPDFASAHCNLGNTLRDLGRLSEAEIAYRAAIRLKPSFADAHGNLGNTLRDLGRLSEAEAACREAIRIKPDFANAHNILGNTLRELGRLTEAEAACREAIRLEPDFANAHINLLFSLNYIERSSTDQALQDAKHLGKILSAKAASKFSVWNTDNRNGRTRIGFVSGDLRNHPVGYFIEGLLRHLDSRKFELFAFPNSQKTDELTSRILPCFHEWVPIYGKSDHEAATIIHRKGIHVLFDLSGHTAHNRLPAFSYKPAPIQVTWLGYFATTGLPEIDYLLGDPFVTPETESHHFTETIWQLPETYLCFTPPVENLSVSGLPALTNGFITFGCLNNLTKMGAAVVELWSRILHSMPSSKLFLKTEQLSDAAIAEDVIDQYAKFGISRDRLILEGRSSRAQHLSSYGKVDVALDPFPFPGGTTSAEALWMGVPVLTLKGDRFLSHIGESIAHNVGHSDWIASDKDDYAAKAVGYAGNLQKLAAMRQTLRRKVLQSPLFDAERFARNFETAIQKMLDTRENRSAKYE